MTDHDTLMTTKEPTVNKCVNGVHHFTQAGVTPCECGFYQPTDMGGVSSGQWQMPNPRQPLGADQRFAVLVEGWRVAANMTDADAEDEGSVVRAGLLRVQARLLRKCADELEARIER